MIISGRYIDLAATALNVLASLWAARSMYLGIIAVPRWRRTALRRAEDRRITRRLARLDDYGAPTAYASAVLSPHVIEMG